MIDQSMILHDAILFILMIFRRYQFYLREWSQKIEKIFRSRSVSFKNQKCNQNKVKNNLNKNESKIQNDNRNSLQNNFENYEEFVLKKFEVTGVEIFLNLFYEIDIQVI